MKKQISIFVLVTALLLLFSVDPVWAGSRARYRWEGVAIGLGAAIIGSALIHCYEPQYSSSMVFYDRPPVRYVPPPVYVRPPVKVIYYSPQTIFFREKQTRHRRHWKPRHTRGRRWR
ncbi:MAG: hypothetical protein JRF28_08905 [Deltaproteobacteria bacterium]|nr:hypothetical protein [Deltaproteobacteria bacterium]MBW2319130.1 hypothetical protein [Deltaproteobacteria bacterium]